METGTLMDTLWMGDNQKGPSERGDIHFGTIKGETNRRINHWEGEGIKRKRHNPELCFRYTLPYI